jgi:hypothetical protein
VMSSLQDLPLQLHKRITGLVVASVGNMP